MKKNDKKNTILVVGGAGYIGSHVVRELNDYEINPYGATKVMVERILSDYCNAYDLKYIALRYFNAAGAHPDGNIGESHRIETHLILQQK